MTTTHDFQNVLHVVKPVCRQLFEHVFVVCVLKPIDHTVYQVLESLEACIWIFDILLLEIYL